MPAIVFHSPDGSSRTVEVADGASVMHAALDQNIIGVIGECGGSMMCATCHVYVRAPWLDKLAPVDATEDAMLTMTAGERRPNSRLSCQIVMRVGLDGIVVELPEKQI